jgi:hypothetical protein
MRRRSRRCGVRDATEYEEVQTLPAYFTGTGGARVTAICVVALVVGVAWSWGAAVCGAAWVLAAGTLWNRGLGLAVRVTSDSLLVRRGHVGRWRVWPLADVASCRAIPDEPRWRSALATREAARPEVYDLHGRGGVLLCKRGGQRMLVGSESPASLCAALARLGVPVEETDGGPS